MNVYDFDGTIYNGDSTVDFFLYALKTDWTTLLFVPKQALGFLRYTLKQIDKTELKEYFFSFLKGIDAERLVDAFWDTHQDRVFDWYRAQQKADDVVISASPEFLLKPICSRLGIHHLIASNVDPRTGVFLDANCKGPEKVRRWNAEYPEAAIEQFYSDSLSDQPIADLAAQAFMVNKGIVSEWKRK